MNRFHHVLISILLLFSVLAPASPRWEVHDVSVLFPLPSSVDQNPMARNEELLPKIWVEQFPRLSVRYDQPTMLRQSTIVSMRIDVFTNQVKLVWQPIIMNGQKSVTTIDAAFHSFYQLTPAEFESFTEKLFKYIKENTKNTYSLEPLNIHPLFSQATAENSKRHMNFMRGLIDHYLTSKNVFKVTTMVLRAADDFWGFLGFELKAGSPAPQPIVIANAEKATVQTFLNQAVPFDHFVNIAISPLQSPTEDSFVDSLLGYVMTTRNAETLTEEQIEKTIRSIRKMENPELMHVDQMDCASCHAAQPILDHLRFTLKDQFNDASETLYKNPDYNLASVHTEINTRRIRGFGYFGNEVAISDRAINESAQNATEMNKKLSQKNKRKGN